MSTLAGGSNITVQMGAYDSLEVVCNGNVNVEYPVGTKVGDFSGVRVFGPYGSGAELKVTAVVGSVEYRVIDGVDSGFPVMAATNPLSGKKELSALGVVFGASKKANQPIAVVRPFAMASSSAATTITRAFVIQLPYRIYGLKLRVFNAVAGSYAGMLASVASSAAAASGVTTAVADATPVLFSGAASATVPAGGGTVPNHSYGAIDSDFLPFFPVDDARGFGCTLHIRTYQPTASNTRFLRPTGAGNPTIAQHGLVAGYQAVDGVTTWGALNAPTATDSLPPVELLLYTDAGVRNIFVGGGSTAGGQDDTTDFGWASRASKLVGSAPAFSVLNWGESGSTTTASLARIMAVIDSEPVKAVAWFPFSTNDADVATVAGGNRMMANAAKFCADMSAKGIAPILCTFQAPTGFSGQSNANRKAVNTVCRNLANAGYCLLIDIAETLSDDTQAVGTWRDLSDTTDGTHPNPQGHAKIAASAVPVFQKVAD